MTSTTSSLISAVDLFCGAGGLTYGLERSGISVKAGVDLDPTCRYPYVTNNKAEFIQSDVADLKLSDIEGYFKGAKYSLLAGCAPCQPFSTYGRSRPGGRQNGDWALVLAFGRLAKELKPDLVTIENVPQLADHKVFQTFLGSLSGYKVQWRIVECADFGIPQSRRRLVLIGSRLDLPLDLPNAKCEIRTVRNTIAHLPKLEAGQTDSNDRLHTASRLSKLNLQRIKASKPGGTWRDWHDSLLAECHRRETGSTYPSVYGRMMWDEVAPTMTTQCFGYGNGRFGHPDQDRAISLREAAMLQTFPQSYEFVPENELVRFSRLGRLIGNAVPVALGEAIGQAIVNHVSVESSI